MSRRARRRHPRPQDDTEQFVETDKQGHVLPDPTPVKFVTTEGEPGGVGGAMIPDEEIDAEVEAREEDAELEADALVDEARGLPLAGPGETPSPTDPGALGDYDDEMEGRYEDGPSNSLLPPEPEFDPEIFERGPLAAGIRMCEALLVEARGGYIAAQIAELESVLDEAFSDPERFFLGNVAAQERTASGLPDVAGAYKALVRARSAVA